jgi:hypothetical protein
MPLKKEYLIMPKKIKANITAMLPIMIKNKLSIFSSVK